MHNLNCDKQQPLTTPAKFPEVLWELGAILLVYIKYTIHTYHICPFSKLKHVQLVKPAHGHAV